MTAPPSSRHHDPIAGDKWQSGRQRQGGDVEASSISRDVEEAAAERRRELLSTFRRRADRLMRMLAPVPFPEPLSGRLHGTREAPQAGCSDDEEGASAEDGGVGGASGAGGPRRAAVAARRVLFVYHLHALAHTVEYARGTWKHLRRLEQDLGALFGLLGENI